jgi:hypothetical protein
MPANPKNSRWRPVRPWPRNAVKRKNRRSRARPRHGEIDEQKRAQENGRDEAQESAEEEVEEEVEPISYRRRVAHPFWKPGLARYVSQPAARVGDTV